MGYDIELTRAPWPLRSARFPIAMAEWEALAARRDDMELHPWGISNPGDGPLNFWFVPGGGQIKNPHDELLRYMVGIATELDAWMIGQDGEVYRVEPDGEVHGEWTPPGERWRSIDGRNHRWITDEEWGAHVAAQADFELVSEIEARCPSGPRLIPCAPTPHWMGHPSGRPVPFIRQSGSVLFPVGHMTRPVPDWLGPITEEGAATLSRARLIAERLSAEIED